MPGNEYFLNEAVFQYFTEKLERLESLPEDLERLESLIGEKAGAIINTAAGGLVQIKDASTGNAISITSNPTAEVFRTGKNLISGIKRASGRNIYIGNENDFNTIFLKAGDYNLSVEFLNGHYGAYYKQSTQSSYSTIWSEMGSEGWDNGTFTLQNDAWIQFCVFKNSGTVDVNDIGNFQLQPGTMRTEYEAYNGVRITHGAQLPMLKGVNNIWATNGDVSVEYIADTKLYIDSRL